MKQAQTTMALSLAALAVALAALTLSLLSPGRDAVSADAANAAALAMGATQGAAANAPESAPQAAEAPASTPDPALLEMVEIQSQRILGLERQLSELQHLVRLAGIDRAAPQLMPPPDSDRPLLAQIGEDYATRARFEERRKQMIEQADGMRERDRETYGEAAFEEIQTLSAEARPQRGMESPEQRQQREAALNQLVTRYPDAWSTSVAVAEQALSEAIQRNTQGVETYYESLISRSPDGEIVTEQGINAIPTLQTYLARQYVQEGRVDEAAAVLDALSAQGDSLILEPNEMGEPTTRQAQEIVSELRAKLAR